MIILNPRTTKPRKYRFPLASSIAVLEGSEDIELQWADQFINLRKTKKRESL
jgi:hypothetical protein